MLNIVASCLVTGPPGVGKSTLAYKALKTEGSGLVLACPLDELDSYVDLQDNPNYLLHSIDDTQYLPSLGLGQPHGFKDGAKWLAERYAEAAAAHAQGKRKWAVLVIDTQSAISMGLVMNYALYTFKIDRPPPAISPEGAAFYTFLRNKQEEFLRLVRGFRAFGTHVIVLSHVRESNVGETSIGKVEEGKTQMYVPALPGSMKEAISGFFSTVLYAGIQRSSATGGVEFYLQWEGDGKKATKNRFGPLDAKAKRIKNDWVLLKERIAAAAAARSK